MCQNHPLSSILSEVDKTTMIHTIRIELTVEVAGEWPGNEAACDAALTQILTAHNPNGMVEEQIIGHVTWGKPLARG